MDNADRYIPALSFRWLLPLYDPLLKWGMHEEHFKRRLIERAQIQPGMRVLDLGCGTGTLTILIKQFHPEADVVGVDGDEQILDAAREKAQGVGVQITWDYGLAFDLPYHANTYDRILSSLVIHHLATNNKSRAFKEVLRVLRPDGEFHIVDFGKPHTIPMRMVSRIMRHLEQSKDNFDGKLTTMLAAAGFSQITEPSQIGTIFGPLSFIRAIKSDHHLALISNIERI
jgi:ubiquinone/menaquinone biosynthesis C-methylase UbiE